MADLKRFWLLALVATLMTACIVPLGVDVQTDDDDVVRGSGRVVDRSWQVAGFSAVTVVGVGNVILEQTGREALTVTGEDNILDHLEIAVVNGELRIRPTPGVGLEPSKELVFRLQVRDLERLEGAGAVGMRVTLASASHLGILISGAVSVTATGIADSLGVTASGVTRFLGSDLKTRTAEVLASGVAEAVVWATEHLTASASGVAHIRYKGSPELHVTVSGLGKVEPY